MRDCLTQPFTNVPSAPVSLQEAEFSMKFAFCASFLERSIYYIHIPCPQNMSGTHLYRIICRKRSGKLEFKHPSIIYWKPNRSGYTPFIYEAGLYTALDLDDCAGNGFDWFAERVVKA